MLDTNNTNVGYVIGRLIAASERIAEANGSPTDRIEKALEIAPNYPMRGVAIVMEPTMHNMSKLQRKDSDLADELDAEYLKITDKLPSDLSNQALSDTDRGMVALGYQQQRAADREYVTA